MRQGDNPMTTAGTSRRIGLRIARIDHLGRSGLAIAAIVAALALPARAQTDDALRAVADAYWEATLDRYPTRATAMGDYRSIDRLDDVSATGREQWKTTLQRLLADLRPFRAKILSPDDQLNRELLERAIRDDLLQLETRPYLMPLSPLNGPHIDTPLLLVSQPFRNVDDYRAYARRLRAFSAQITDHITNMREGMSLGLVSPRVTMEKVVPQIRMHLVTDPTASEFFAPVREARNLPDGARDEIAKEIGDAISTSVIPGYLQLLGFLQDEYLPHCREEVGIGSAPYGQDVYRSLAYLNMTVRLDPDDVHRIGLSEVERLRGEMDNVRASSGFEGTLDEFIARMRSDPKQRFESREELIAAADKILQRTRPLMSKLFGRLPAADCVMKEIESYRARSAPVAYYNPTPEDGSRPGYYYINTYAPQERLRFTLEALSYHEAIPGHHFQMALDQENRDIPRFRRYGNFTAYIEGWALYAEKLGFDIDGYTDTDQLYGQLTFEMWRACRLVVDTGMHVKGWTRQQAIDFMTRNTSLAPIDIEAEVDRYISWPGQALGYKIGELRISALRKEAETGLGSKFDIRAFHDALLGGGAMPIDILEKRMHAWIEKAAKQ